MIRPLLALGFLLLTACKAVPNDSSAPHQRGPSPSAVSVVADPTDERVDTSDARPTRRTSKARTKVVMLGTGTPNPDPDRSGPSVALVVNGAAYVVDFGAGIVRRAAAAEALGHGALAAEKLTRAFATHLHSDHTLGYADLILTPWVMGREVPLEVYGPPGLEDMTKNILKAYDQDIRVRLRGAQPSTDRGFHVNVHEIEPGPIYRDGNVKVSAFAVKHGAWKTAFGYHFETDDRRVVISGDTRPTESVIAACKGCDVLVHEVYVRAGWIKRSSDWQAYHKAAHTSSFELGELAAKARPKLLVLYHQLSWGGTREEALTDIRRSYEGEVVWANDLDVF